MIQVKAEEFEEIVNKWHKGEMPGVNIFDDYEIIPDFEPVDNKIIEWCLHSRIKDNGNTLYYGGHFHKEAYSFSQYVRNYYNVESVFHDGYRAVLADRENLYIYSYCEHDIYVEKFNSLEDLEVGIQEAKEFYEVY